MKVTKDIVINDLIAIDDGIISILMGAGMHCIGCLAAHGESLEQACYVHGIDPDLLTEDINNYLESLS